MSIPTDTHASGDTGHVTDHNNIADCLAAITGLPPGGSITTAQALAFTSRNGTPLDGPSSSHQTVWRQADGSIVVLPLSAYGISGDDSVWINKAYTYLPVITGGSASYGATYNGPWIMGTIRLLPADYQISTGIVAPVNSGATVNLIGHGPGTRMICASGVTGFKSHVAMGGPQVGQPAEQNMGTTAGMRFDGSGGAAKGVEIGGGWGRKIDVACVNFSATGAIGLHLNNAGGNVSSEWFEKCRVKADLMQNTIACKIENSGTDANGDSFEYNDITLYIIASNAVSPASQGVLVRGGAFLSGGALRIRGNFPGNSGPVLSITGNDGSGGNSHISNQVVDIGVECNGTSNFPQTLNFDSGGTGGLNDCTGKLCFAFSAASWTQSNATAAQFSFGGVIKGDTHLTSINTNPSGWL